MTEFLSRPEIYTITGVFVVFTICLAVIAIALMIIADSLNLIFSKYTKGLLLLVLNMSKYNCLLKLKYSDIYNVRMICEELSKLRQVGEDGFCIVWKYKVWFDSDLKEYEQLIEELKERKKEGKNNERF